MISISKLYCGRAGASDDLRFPKERGRKPIVVFNCTSRCNLSCIHCYSASDSSCHGEELSTAQAKNLLSQLADYRCPVVLFSGGEPLLRPDIFELLQHAAALDLPTVLSTNGTLIDEQTAARLKSAQVRYVGISLDGPATEHDRFRRCHDSFRLAVKGLHCCAKAGLSTGIRFTMTADNIESVETIFDIALAADVKRICFYHLINSGRAAEMKIAAPSFVQTRKALDSVIDLAERFVEPGQIDQVLTVGNHADGPYLLLKMKSKNHPLYGQAIELLRRSGGNRIGQNIASVSSDGAVHPDQFWRNYSLGNITQTPFGVIWDNAADPVLNILRNRDKFKDPRCARCRWFELCKGNFRCLADDVSIENWKNEPTCFLTDEEIET